MSPRPVFPPASGIPASGTLLPKFRPGNLSPLSHGARSPRVYGQLAQRLAAGLVADRPDLASYPEAVAHWATCEAQAALLRRHIAEVGTIDPQTGEPRAASLTWLRSFERAAREARQPLGLDPMSEAVLSRTRAEAVNFAAAVDLDALAAKGAAIIAARQTEPPDLVGEVLEAERAAYSEERAQAWREVNGHE